MALSPEGPPPSYAVAMDEALFAAQPTLADDGRVNVNINPRSARTLSRLINQRLPKYQVLGEHEDKPIPPKYSVPSVHSLQEQVPWQSFPVKLNIVIQIVGSRGDVQPFVALGVELKRHGHRVRLATHNVFESFVRDAGVDFYPIGGDPAELMAYMVRNPGLIPSMGSLRSGDIQKKRHMVKEMLDGFWQSCIANDPYASQPFVADAIIANPPSFASVHCAQALGIPAHLMFTMPWTSTAAFPHPLVNLKWKQGDTPEPMMANYISYAVVEFLTWQGLGDVINTWRESLDLEAIAFSEGPLLAEKLKIPTTYCWSPALVPKPEDWGSHIDVCGFFFRQMPDYEPDKELRAFLDGGPPPVYIGFGSIVIDDPQAMSGMLLEAVRLAGTRAIISKGWSKLGGSAGTDVMFLGDCPHEWLFQHVAAVMHHGGAGTTACGLLNGRPTSIVPFFGDQPFWGDMVSAAGAGPKPIPYKALTTDKIVEALRFCLTPGAARAAARIAAKMRLESGVERAVASFHANLPMRELECDIVKGQPASWTFTTKDTRWKLSKVAAEVLGSHLLVDARRLKIHNVRPIRIETHRWDPFTGTVAAAMSVSADLARAAADTIIEPAKALRRQRAANDDDVTELTDGHTETTQTVNQPRPKNSRGCMDVTKTIALTSGAGMGRFLKTFSTGLVLIPYAYTEGFRNIPLLYGESVRDFGAIEDWKSGVLVGGKTLVFGVYDGITGLVILPVKGAKEEGAFGAVKGVGKGVAGLTTKVFTATIGIATYPLQGIYKTVMHAACSSTRRSIELALSVEGRYLAQQGRDAGRSDKIIMDSFNDMRSGIPTSRESTLANQE